MRLLSYFYLKNRMNTAWSSSVLAVQHSPAARSRIALHV
jgi:hypothetical protein